MYNEGQRLVEWSLPTPEVHGSNPVFGKNLYRTLSDHCIEKTKIKKKRPGLAHLKKYVHFRKDFIIFSILKYFIFILFYVVHFGLHKLSSHGLTSIVLGCDIALISTSCSFGFLGSSASIGAMDRDTKVGPMRLKMTGKTARPKKRPMTTTRKKILKKTMKTCDPELANKIKAKKVEKPPLKTAEMNRSKT